MNISLELEESSQSTWASVRQAYSEELPADVEEQKGGHAGSMISELQIRKVSPRMPISARGVLQI